MTAEYWKPVPGYEGLYEVSDQGRVKRLPGPRARKDRFLTPGVTKSGHLNVTLCKDGKPKSFLIHRLVASVFVLGDKSLGVNHLDGDPQNNAASNLEYATQKRNVEHAYELGLNPTKIPRSLWRNVFDRVMEGERQVDIAKEFECSKGNIHYIVKRFLNPS